jgi:hypothetical protein
MRLASGSVSAVDGAAQLLLSAPEAAAWCDVLVAAAAPEDAARVQAQLNAAGTPADAAGRLEAEGTQR